MTLNENTVSSNRIVGLCFIERIVRRLTPLMLYQDDYRTKQ